MIIFFWLICFTLFIATSIFLAFILLKNPQTKEKLRTLYYNIQNLLQNNGLRTPRPRYPLELWIWEAVDDDACEECLERESWPPMDIADWMSEGLPGTPESDTECGENCRCQLIPYKTSKSNHKH